MPTPITAEDLAAALTAFAISFTAALMAPRSESPEHVLQALANELDDMAGKVGDTPVAAVLKTTATMLILSESRR